MTDFVGLLISPTSFWMAPTLAVTWAATAAVTAAAAASSTVVRTTEFLSEAGVTSF